MSVCIYLCVFMLTNVWIYTRSYHACFEIDSSPPPLHHRYAQERTRTCIRLAKSLASGILPLRPAAGSDPEASRIRFAYKGSGGCGHIPCRGMGSFMSAFRSYLLLFCFAFSSFFFLFVFPFPSSFLPPPPLLPLPFPSVSFSSSFSSSCSCSCSCCCSPSSSSSFLDH